MTSREIAEMTGKLHKDVLYDIRTMLDALDKSLADFSAQYKDSTGRTLPMYSLPKRETLILVSGYSVTMRAKIIDRWQELESQATQATPAPFAIPTSLGAALRLAADLQDKVVEQAEHIEYLEPQAKAFKRWVTSEVLPSIRKHGGYVTKTTTPPPEARKRPRTAKRP